MVVFVPFLVVPWGVENRYLLITLCALLERLQNSQIQLSRGVISENFVEVDVNKPAHAYFAVGVTKEGTFNEVL
jgi:hypothetical protein